ncbi:MAG: hypothetical protein HY884_08380 [Deltaproteobacteria bacterium]|nr:hypothetical protein [Deltaproteobacteria bacterium]
MSEGFPKEFFALYHAAVFEAIGDDAPKYNAKIGALLANAWAKRLNELPSGHDGFKRAIEEFFKGAFRFADTAELTFKLDGTAELYVKGCGVCLGNEILRGKGKKGSCPISQMLKSAMGKSLKGNVELTGSEKPGPVGECYLRYNVHK